MSRLQSDQPTASRLSFLLVSFPPLLLVLLIALFVILPLLRPGLPATADTPIHFYRTLEFAQSWNWGMLYPRWAPHLAYGYGYPLWIFAPPLPYVISLLLTALGAPLETGLKGLVIFTALLYASGAWLFVRRLMGWRAGLIAAAIYTLSPFALREALLYGGNYPQYLAIGLYPWVLWGISRTRQHPTPKNILLTAALYGAVMLSHLFHVLILTPVAIGYALIELQITNDELRMNAAKHSRLSFVIRHSSFLAMVLGLLLTAFFWIPAFFERRYTRATDEIYLAVSPITSRFLNWGELLAWPQPLDARAANPWVPFSLGLAALTLAALGVLAVIFNIRPYRSQTEFAPPPPPRSFSPLLPFTLFFLTLLATTVFMMLPASAPLWTTIPLLAVAEFPWRLLGLANLSLAFLGGASALWLQKIKGETKQTLILLAALLLILLSSGVYLYPPRPFVNYGDTLEDMNAYELATQTIGTTTLGEYLPKWVQHVPTGPPNAKSLAQDKGIEKLDPASLPSQASATLLEHRPAGDAYRFNSPVSFQARFFTFYYPGWRAKLDGQPQKIVIEAKSGLITVPIPAGEHTLRLRFTDTPLRRAANFITLASIAGALVALGFIAFHPKEQRTKDERRKPRFPHPSSFILHPSSLLLPTTLIALLLLKTLIVDPHTTWFRRQSPPKTVIGAQHALKSNLNNQFWLLGYDLNRSEAKPGQELRVVLYWQAQKPVDVDYRSFTHLDAPVNQRTWAASDNFHPGDSTAQIDIPTTTWDTEHYVRDEHFLRIPQTAPPVEFLLRAGLYNPLTGQRLPLTGKDGNAVTLQNIRVLPGKNLPEIPNPVAYRLGKAITLQGFAWNDENKERAALTLFWQTKQLLPEDYVVFVHLLDENGQLAWGADGPPLDGLYPTSAWHPHTAIADIRSLNLTGIPSGRYTLAVGLYHPDTLQRLPVTDARGKAVTDNAIRLVKIEVN